MKVTYTFTLPEDWDELQMVYHASDLYHTVREFREYLRSQIKYEDKVEYEPIRDHLNEMLRDAHCDFEVQ